MNPETKRRLIIYLKYILFEPWSSISIPNYSTINWILLFFAVYFKYDILIFILLFTGITLYLVKEYKSGRHIYWYNMQKYKDNREALKKVREERKNKQQEIKNENP